MTFDELKEKFNESDYTCLIIKDGEEVFSSSENGILPIVQGVSKMNGAFLADKVIGRAAALICVHGGVVAVHARLMTISAAEVLAGYGILFEADKMVEEILNRDKTGLCPFEILGKELKCPKQAFGRIVMKLQGMGANVQADLGCGGNCGGGCNSK